MTLYVRGFLLVVLALAGMTDMAWSRDAAFLDPGSSGGGSEAVKVDPKPEIDVGETVLGVAKRASVFFVNQTNLPVKIEKVVLNNDSNVTAEATANDCTKQGVIAPQSRCSVEVSATPTSSGSWNIDVLMTHDGAGRITRAKLTGKTTGGGSGEKSTGLSVNTKEIKPVDFGDVEIGDGKVVRSTLMINDSAEPITVLSIDVIEADNGLQRLDQGCAVDMELAPGASCPVTLVWSPRNNGAVSTDLIIRHSGKLGFAVIPIRGSAKGGTASASSTGGGNNGGTGGDKGKGGTVPLPPSAQDLEKAMAGVIPPVSDAALGIGAGGASGAGGSGGDSKAHLIGTIGDKALIFKPNGETEVVPMGGEFDMGGKTAKIVAITPRSVDIAFEGQRKTLKLETVDSLVSKAADSAKQEVQNETSIPAAGRKK